ncbi:MAG: AI-2E family transporter [Lachnospiraceae bacterium]|nr:AI-2E family transporter [Lachnospiraceae bacterium]
MFKESLKKYAGIMIAVSFSFIIVIGVFFVIYKFDRVLGLINDFIRIVRPFLYGLIIAYILRPVSNRIENLLKRILAGRTKLKSDSAKKISKWSGIILSILSAVLLIYILIVMIVPQIIETTYQLIEILPDYFNKSVEYLRETLSKYVHDSDTIQRWYERIYEAAFKWVNEDLLPNVQDAVAGFSSGVVNVVSFIINIGIGVIVAIYLLANKKKFLAQAKMVIYSIFSKTNAEKIFSEARYTDKVFSGFISGKIVDSIIIGVLCYIILLIFKIPYPLLISVIIGITNIIPFFGPIIGAVPSVMIIFIIDPVKAFTFILIVIILQFFDGNILGPKILGDATGLEGFWVLFAVTVFGGLFGLFGMIIGVPVFAVLYDIFRRLITDALRKKNQNELLEDYSEKFTSKDTLKKERKPLVQRIVEKTKKK